MVAAHPAASVAREISWRCTGPLFRPRLGIVGKEQRAIVVRRCLLTESGAARHSEQRAHTRNFIVVAGGTGRTGGSGVAATTTADASGSGGGSAAMRRGAGRSERMARPAARSSCESRGWRACL